MLLNSFISWKGGKRALRDIILSRFPLEYDRYVEVFGGGGWVFFHKTPEKGDVYNDYNRHLYNLFRTVKERTVSLVNELGFLSFNSRDDFFMLRDFLEQKEFDDHILTKELALTEHVLPPLEAKEIKDLLTKQLEPDALDIQRAAAFYKVIRYSYASGCTSFGCKTINIRNFFYLIWQASRRLEHAVVENQDFETLVRHYDREGTFFYLDPPYFEAEDYAVDFPVEDHMRLRDLLLSTQGKIMLSYNDEPYIREIYDHPDIYLESFQRLDNIAQRYNPGQQYGELIITNYDPKERMNNYKQLTLADY